MTNFGKKLYIMIAQREKSAEEKSEGEKLKKRILRFKAKRPTSFGDAAEWECNEREDHQLPFSR
jgi:hypothetical protein